MQIAGRTLNLPQDMLFFSGVSQVNQQFWFECSLMIKWKLSGIC